MCFEVGALPSQVRAESEYDQIGLEAAMRARGIMDSADRAIREEEDERNGNR